MWCWCGFGKAFRRPRSRGSSATWRHGHTHAFTVDFDDAAARDAYLALPEHESAGARLVRATEGGLAGLIVLDIEIA